MTGGSEEYEPAKAAVLSLHFFNEVLAGGCRGVCVRNTERPRTEGLLPRCIDDGTRDQTTDIRWSGMKKGMS